MSERTLVLIAGIVVAGYFIHRDRPKAQSNVRNIAAIGRRCGDAAQHLDAQGGRQAHPTMAVPHRSSHPHPGMDGPIAAALACVFDASVVGRTSAAQPFTATLAAPEITPGGVDLWLTKAAERSWDSSELVRSFENGWATDALVGPLTEVWWHDPMVPHTLLNHARHELTRDHYTAGVLLLGMLQSVGDEKIKRLVDAELDGLTGENFGVELESGIRRFMNGGTVSVPGLPRLPLPLWASFGKRGYKALVPPVEACSAVLPHLRCAGVVPSPVTYTWATSWSGATSLLTNPSSDEAQRGLSISLNKLDVILVRMTRFSPKRALAPERSPAWTATSPSFSHSGDGPPRPREVNAELLPELAAIVERARAKQRGDRYPSMEALLSDLATLHYAAVTPELVAEEHQNTLAKLATKYRPAPTPTAAQPGPGDASQPDQLLDHLVRWVRKNAAPAPSPAPDDLLQRIERLRRDVQSLTQPAAK